MKHTRAGALSWLGDFKTLTLALLVVLSGCLLLAGKLQASTIPQWEYKVVGILKHTHIDDYNRYLNELGQDGWEMVSVERFILHGGNDSWRFFFKRPYQPGQTPSGESGYSGSDSIQTGTYSNDKIFQSLAEGIMGGAAGVLNATKEGDEPSSEVDEE